MERQIVFSRTSTSISIERQLVFLLSIDEYLYYVFVSISIRHPWVGFLSFFEIILLYIYVSIYVYGVTQAKNTFFAYIVKNMWQVSFEDILKKQLQKNLVNW
jgi:hypothetical protein